MANFQAVGPDAANERSPNLDVVLGTTKSSGISERNPFLLRVVAFLMENTVMYNESSLCSELYTSWQHLKVILRGTRSQCNLSFRKSDT